MSDERAFFALFARAAFLQLCDMGVRLLLLKSLTARLTTDDYGTYAFWSAVAAMGTIAFGGELYRYLQRHVLDTTHASSWLRSQLFAESALVLLVASLVALLQRTELGVRAHLPAGGMLLVVVALVWTELMIVELVRFAVLRGRGGLGEGAKLIRSVATLVAVTSIPQLSTASALLVVVVANCIAVSVLARVPFSERAGRVSWAEVRAQLVRMTLYATMFVIPALANQLLKVGDRFFVFGALSAGELARYSVAYNLQLLCFGATGGLASTLVYPLVLRDAGMASRRARWLWIQVLIQAVASSVLFVLSGRLFVWSHPRRMETRFHSSAPFLHSRCSWYFRVAC